MSKPTDTEHEEGERKRPILRNVLWGSAACLVVAVVTLITLSATSDDGSFLGIRSSRSSSTEVSFRCIHSNEELHVAIDAILGQSVALELVQAKYGPNPESWCFTTDDFSHVFDVLRNPKLVESPDLVLNVSGWNLSTVTNLSHAFRGRDEMEHVLIIGMEDWDTSLVEDMTQTFRGFHGEDLDLSGWITSSVVTLQDTFRDLHNTSILGVELWDVSSVSDFSGLFREAWEMNPDVGSWNMTSATTISRMFHEAWSFEGMGVDAWDTTGVTDMSHNFRDAFSFRGDVSGWITSSVNQMQWMFSGARSYDGDLTSWDVSQVTDLNYVFFRAFSFTDGGIGNWDVSSVTNMAGMFRDSSFSGDLSSWDTSSVWNLLECFRGASVNPGNLSAWDVRSVSTTRLMFADSMYEGDLSSWKLTSLVDAFAMFQLATEFTGTGIATWELPQLNNAAFMLDGASSFNEDLCAWSLSSVNVTNMLVGTSCSSTADPTATAACAVC